jgi:hypothetical protein
MEPSINQNRSFSVELDVELRQGRALASGTAISISQKGLAEIDRGVQKSVADQHTWQSGSLLVRARLDRLLFVETAEYCMK